MRATASDAGHNDGMRIEILHIDECPNWQAAGRLVSEVLAELDLTWVAPEFVLIRTPDEAAAAAFAGSPTLLIDGVDVVPGTPPAPDLACRVYTTGHRLSGLPSRDSVRGAILAAAG